MDIEFHYYITNIIARHAGFSPEDSKTIAFSSQYVDDNDISFTINKGKEGEYNNFISQTMNILKPKNKLLRIYPTFHFVPGEPSAESAYRRDGKQHILNTIPDNENAQKMLAEAFKTDEAIRLYQIGVATHAFVDTWAHQNFVGWYDDFNAIGKNVLPNIGHADAGHNPDYPAHLWKDKRIIPGKTHINNIDRFLEAGERLFEEYKKYLAGKASNSSWELVKGTIEKAIGDIQPDGEKKEERIKRYKEIEDIETFKELKWFDAAIITDVRGLKDSKEGLRKEYLTFFRDRYRWKDDIDYKKSDWCKFQRAVKSHERAALDLLEPVFKKMAIDIRNA